VNKGNILVLNLLAPALRSKRSRIRTYPLLVQTRKVARRSLPTTLFPRVWVNMDPVTPQLQRGGLFLSLKGHSE
jgi:transposase InsO family protein